MILRYRDPVKNITVAVPDDVYARARVHAAEAGTSVSNLVANFLRTVAADTDDEFARLVALQRQVQSSVVGFSARDNVSRDEAHDRAPR